MSGQMVTANRLQDGLVVYLSASGDWAPRFSDGVVLPDKPAAEAALVKADHAVKERQIVGPYLIDVLVDEEGVKPTSTRERIRADRGPTIVVDAGTWSGRIGD